MHFAACESAYGWPAQLEQLEQPQLQPNQLKKGKHPDVQVSTNVRLVRQAHSEIEGTSWHSQVQQPQ
jgi:hypothetical protein